MARRTAAADLLTAAEIRQWKYFLSFRYIHIYIHMSKYVTTLGTCGMQLQLIVLLIYMRILNWT